MNLSRRDQGSAADSSHIFETIRKIADQGGRLVSVELTGMGGEQLEIQRQLTARQAQHQYWRTGTMPVMRMC